MTIALDLLPHTAFLFLLVFTRVGAIAMALPGIGDQTIPPRIRLVFALALTLVLLPLVARELSELPSALPAMLVALVREAIVGLAIGFAVRLIVSAVQLAGSTIAFQTGLAFAQNVDPSQGVQSTLFGNFLSVLAVALMFATDLHHLLIVAIHDSYTLFRPGADLPVGDFAVLALATVTDAFRVAMQLSAPFLAFGLIFYLGIGVLSRLIPQVQVFFLAMPANIMLGFALLMLLLGTAMVWYLDYFARAVRPLLS